MSEITIETILPYIKLLDRILTAHNVCKSHGTRHAIAVSIHAINALKHNPHPITQTESLAVVLAALLHDADDHKFFPANDDYQNLRSILQSELETSRREFIDLVVNMVSLVSSSTNGDTIPDDIHAESSYWKLIPRYADRLEALGVIGIVRCRKYNITCGKPIFVDTTPRPTTVEEVMKYASIERYNAYNGASDSMMDHYFDKLIRLGCFPPELANTYFDRETMIRNQPIIDFVLFFSSKPHLSESDVDQYILDQSFTPKNDSEAQFDANIDWIEHLLY